MSFSSRSILSTLSSVHSLIVFTLVIMTVLVVVFSGNVNDASSSTSDNLSGYAWSDTIGWISMNCASDSGCGASDYGVSVDSSGAISGYAWSSNVGWISFNVADVVGCPSGSCAPELDRVTGSVTGWAKVLSGDNANSGGWDGFISLSGTGYGVSVSGPEAGCVWDGYAWGSDVVGWVKFSADTSPVSALSSYGVIGTDFACQSEPDGYITVTNCSISLGDSTCTNNVDWVSNYFVGTPSVSQDTNEFSVSGSGSESRSVGFGVHAFTLKDTGSVFSDVALTNIGCTGTGVFSTGLNECISAPSVDIVVSSLIGNGNEADVDVEIISDYDMSCVIYGTEISPQNFSHTAPIIIGDSVTYSFVTASLTSTQKVLVVCELNADTTITDSDEERIDVTVRMQEV